MRTRAPLFFSSLLYAPLFFFLLCCALLPRPIAALTFVDCPIDCGSTPDIAAEVQQCLVDQATFCYTKDIAVNYQFWPSDFGIFNRSIVNATFPDPLFYFPLNQTVPRIDCNGVMPNGALDSINDLFYFICIEVTLCYIDPDALVSVELTGVCDPTTLSVPGVGAIAYIGPATFLGPCLNFTEDGGITNVYFTNITFDGNATTLPMICGCNVLTSNITMIDCTISNFLGPYVFKVEACDYFVTVELYNLQMHDIPGTALYVEGLWSFVLYDFNCSRCATTNNSECIHFLMSPVSLGELDIINPNCFAIADLLPPRCRYCLTGEAGFCGSRCNEGIVQAYDRLSTEQFANCPLVQFSFIDFFPPFNVITLTEFDPICRVWTKPECNWLGVVPEQNITNVFQFGGGDIIWIYDAPLICVPGGAISPQPGPFYITLFDNILGDPVPTAVLPPLPTAPAFNDPSFESFGTNWTENAVLNANVSPFVIAENPSLFPPPDGVNAELPFFARTGIYAVRCDNDADKFISQYVQASLAEVGIAQAFTFWGARRVGQQFRYTGRFVNLNIDGIMQDQIAEPTFSGTLVADQTYYQFTLNWTPADTATHLLTIECDFTGGTNGVTFVMDDFSWPLAWAGSVLLDPSVEKHSLTWTDTPQGEVILPDNQTPCTPLQGQYVMQCGLQGADRRANQMVTFTQDGVYAVRFHASRLNSLANYAGLTIDIVDGAAPVGGNVPIDAEHFPNANQYYTLTQEGGGIVISGAPVTLDLGLRCNFVAAGSNVNLCIELPEIVAVGVVGTMPSTLGFSSQTISSNPFIVNQTCDCSNFTAPARNETEFPCAYKLNDDAICVESVPYCCFTPWLVEPVLLPFVLTPNISCTDLNVDPPCVFLLDCDIPTPPGVVATCREFTCPFNASNPSLPLASLGAAGHDYILANCMENVLTNWTDSLLYPDGVEFGGSGGLTFYVPQPPAGTLYFSMPTAYFVNCPQADDPTCLIYTGCDWPPLFDPASQLYQIDNCDFVNCTAPSGIPPSTQTELAACALVNSSNTLTHVDGGWAFEPIDAALLFDETQLLFYLNKYVVEAGNSTDPIDFFTLPPDEAALLPSCEEPQYFVQCLCADPSGTYTVPANSTNSDPATTDTFYTCSAGNSSCRCDAAAIQASNPPPPGTIGLHQVVAPDRLSLYRVLNVRMQQYQYGEIIEQVPYELMTHNTIAIPQFFDSRARCRLSIRNDNEFCRGSPGSGGADCYEGNINGPYSEACNILNTAGPGPALPCEMWYGQFAQITSEDQFDCIVDDRATDNIVGFGSTIFNDITSALLGCNFNVIGVRANSQSSYYEENLDIQKANKNIFLITLDSAIVVGFHTIGTNADNVTLVGFNFVHPADNQSPLFSVPKREDDSNLNNFIILNAQLDGSGCRKCGVVNTPRINRMTVNYTLVTDWEFFALKIDDVDQITMGLTNLNSTSGRSLLIKYNRGYIFDRIGLLNVRGGSELNGAALVSLTAKHDAACDLSDLDHTCLFRHVVQHVDTSPSQPRFRDDCFYFARGSAPPEHIYDVGCQLAQLGMVFLKTMAIGSADLVYLMQANPLNRPSLFWVDGQPKGSDYVLRSTLSQVSDGGTTLFKYDENVMTNYDQSPFLLPFVGELHCQSNINWDERYGFGTVLAPGPSFVPMVPRMGVERFHNASIMVTFCQDRRVVPALLPPFTPGPAYIGRVRPFNGSSLNPEVLNVTRDAYLIGDDTDACCKLHRFYPTIEGVAHRVQTNRINMSELRFSLPFEAAPFDMWSSGPLRYDAAQLSTEQTFSQTIPNEVCLLDVIADGVNRLPTVNMWAFNLLVGEAQVSPVFAPGTNKPPPDTAALVVVRNSTVKRFPAFNSETIPGGGGNYIPGEYPYVQGMHFQVFNRLSCDSVVYIFNLTVANVDAAGLDIEFANNITVCNSSFYNCSGRALGNEACVSIVGNDVSQIIGPSTKQFNATAYFLNTTAVFLWCNNTGLQTNTVLFPQDDHEQPGWVTHWFFSGFPNTTDYCVLNGSAEGLPLAMREWRTQNTTLLQCSRYAAPSPIAWPDLSRYLRGQCISGSLQFLSGTEHDLAYGGPNTDTVKETYFCDSAPPGFICCPLVAPLQCWVTQTPSLLTPDNPWLNVYIFASLNQAILLCNSTERVITVIGSGDPFGTGDTTQKTYTEVISATVPLMAVSGATGPLLIRAGPGVRWRAIGNKLVTQCVPTQVTGFVFQHTNAGPLPIWDQTAPSDDACGLRLRFNFWNVTFDAWAVRAVVGDFFEFYGNVIRGHSVTRHAVEVVGNGTCTDVGVVVSHNNIADVLGVGIDVQDLSCFKVNSNKMQNVGGQDTTASRIPYSLRVGICAAPVAFTTICTEIESNDIHTTQITTALFGQMATCWFEPVPIDMKRIVIKGNECRGLEFGMRLDNIPDNSPASDPKAQLRGYCLDNPRTKGLKLLPSKRRFDFVRGPPSDDASLIADPNSAANVGRWCTDCCPKLNMWLLIGAAILIGALLLMLLLCCIVCNGCTPPWLQPPIVTIVRYTPRAMSQYLPLPTEVRDAVQRANGGLTRRKPGASTMTTGLL